MRKDYHILIVDDNERIRSLISIVLSNMGFSISQLDSGKSVLKYCRQNLPDLVIVDAVMPDMDGFEVYNKLKSNRLTCNIPIVFLASREFIDGLVPKVYTEEIQYIYKPISISCLVYKTLSLLGIPQQLITYKRLV